MIPRDERLWMPNESVRGPDKITDIIDWDQRMWINVNGSVESLPPEKEVEVEVVRRHIDHLSPSVHSITVDDDGLLVSVSSNPADDTTLIGHFPRFAKCPSLQGCQTIDWARLTELDRIEARADLMSYLDEAGVEKKVIFKYTMTVEWRDRIWEEMHRIKDLPEHPNLVSFDHVVVDGPDSRVIGFTTKFILGGTLSVNKSRPFTMSHLEQLTSVVDFLNLEQGIEHQDVAPRNILVRPETNQLCLFDFDWSTTVGSTWYAENRNDVKGVIFTVYEIITQDDSFQLIPDTEKDEISVLSMKEWPVKCQLDCDIAQYRQYLDDWIRRRKEGKTASRAATGEIKEIPDIPPPTPIITGHDDDGKPMYYPYKTWGRNEARRMGVHVVEWQRPPQDKAYPARGTKRKAPDCEEK